MPVNAEMKDHVYKILELVGSSEKSIEDAIQNAITREMVRSRANQRPYRKGDCWPLPGHVARWIYARALILGKTPKVQPTSADGGQAG